MSRPATEPAPHGDEADAIDRVFRAEWARVVAALARAFGDLDLAEEATQEAFAAAARTWPSRGTPPNPGGWITTTARRRAIDHLRRDSRRQAGHEHVARHDPLGRAGAVHGSDRAAEMEAEVLGLILACCHPALDQPTQVALTLRLVAGLETRSIARAFLLSEPTVAQRLVRAKRTLRRLGISVESPDPTSAAERLPQVLAVIHLVFNEGYVATEGANLDRPELVVEAVHLGRLLARLVPDDPEVRGLLALMLLTESRRPARVAADGSLVPLALQDRRKWDRRLVAEGQVLVRSCLREGRPGPYQIQAAINAVHSDAASVDDTDWRQILALYDQLMAFAPTPVVALNRAIAVAEVHGPAVALGLIDELAGDLDGYHLWHAVRADLLERCGDGPAAAAAFLRAIELTANEPERRHLRRRLRQAARDLR